MTNKEYLAILNKGVEEWNQWREKNPSIKIDLSGANLSDRNLEGINLSNVNLGWANLSKSRFHFANLSQSFLYDANLRDTIFHHTNISSAFMEGAILFDSSINHSDLSNVRLLHANLGGTRIFKSNLVGAKLGSSDFGSSKIIECNLSGADLTHTRFIFTKLINSNLSQTRLNSTVFSMARLENCSGLETVNVSNVCSIDPFTISWSKNVPKVFLLKIGLSETQINQATNFLKRRTQKLFPVFLSHSWANKDFAGKLYDALIDKGVQVWYDEKQMKPGDNIYEGISEGISVYDKMILVCSEDSLNSWWVDQEMNRIFKKEREYQKANGKKLGLLIPITVDDTIRKWKGAKGETIRDSVIGDFTEWKDESKFEQSLNDLIEALNVDRENNTPQSFIK